MTARILIVDDVMPNRKLLQVKLEREYFDVLTASSGAEALDIVKREQPDLILLDVMMPDMDGFEVCRQLKKDPATAFLPVVLVTGLDHPEDRVAGLQAGADDFLTKPLDDTSLYARVRSLVRLKFTVDELRSRGDAYRETDDALLQKPIVDASSSGLVRKSSAPACKPATRSSGGSSNGLSACCFSHRSG
ncbi:MAG: response regulator, partial [Pseudomonadota bacterium]